MDNIIRSLDKYSVRTVAFLQSFLFLIYVSLVATFMNNAESLFGPMPKLLGPMMFLTLFAFSVLISGILAMGYPFVLFWIQKKPKKAVKVVLWTAVWIFVYFASLFAIVLIT